MRHALLADIDIDQPICFLCKKPRFSTASSVDRLSPPAPAADAAEAVSGWAEGEGMEEAWESEGEKGERLRISLVADSRREERIDEVMDE